MTERRCAKPTCLFHTEPLVWCGGPFPLKLDPDTQQWLCPACYYQKHGTKFAK